MYTADRDDPATRLGAAITLIPRLRLR